jgi:hypothetical protein
MRWHVNLNITLFFYIRVYLADVVAATMMATMTDYDDDNDNNKTLDDDALSHSPFFF